MDKFLVKKTKAKPKAKKPRKAKQPAKKTVMAGKQVGKVKTGAVVQIDLSKRVQPRTSTNKALYQAKADLLSQSLAPVLTALSGQQAMAQSNIERLQMERDRLRQQAMIHQNARIKALEAGKPGLALDEMKRSRILDKASQNIGTEIRVRESEIQTDLPELPSMSTQTDLPTEEKKRPGRPPKATKEQKVQTEEKRMGKKKKPAAREVASPGEEMRRMESRERTVEVEAGGGRPKTAKELIAQFEGRGDKAPTA